MRASRRADDRHRLAPGEVHVWLMDLDRLPDGGARTIGPVDAARARDYLSPRDGARFAAGRAWLRVILGCYLDVDPSRLEFETPSGGRPGVAGKNAATIYFSLSRSAHRGLVAVSCSPVGADIELIRARAGLADLAVSRFGAAEARCIARGCDGSPLRGFYRHWTAKEAYLKATGRGLAGLRGTDLCCGARPVMKVGGHLATSTVSLLDAGPDCAAAIVGSGPVTRCEAAPQ
jgi:4'-phosphopantetheinyl transferase